ncbi:hypothetical protein FSOLCH5_008905 [Fusarium solani]
MVLAIDGTEWASVTLEPKNWAYLSRAKALDFKNRNPIDPGLLRMKLKNLRRMKFKDGEEEGLASLQKEVTDCQKTVTELNLKLDQAKAATSDTDPEAKKRIEAYETELTDAKAKFDGAKEKLEQKRTEHTSKEKTADGNLQKTTKELYELEKKVSAARKKLAEDDTTDKASSKKELATAVDELEKGKDKWIEERRVLQAAQSRKAMAEMEMTGRENMLNSVKNRISQLDRQIEAIEAQIRASSVPARGLPSAIIDIDANRNIIHADHSCLLHDLFLNMSAPSPAHKRKRGDDSPSGRSLAREEGMFERVAPDGDVIFVLGGGTDKVQVQSSIMKSASPVFSAMLAGHFREGQMLHDAAASGLPVEIPLPGDDSEAFKLICIAIHRQASTTQYWPSEEVLMRVLQIADKYNLIDSVFLSMEFWARKYVPDPTLNHFLLMIICHQIKSQELFQLFSRSLVLNHGGVIHVPRYSERAAYLRLSSSWNYLQASM